MAVSILVPLCCAVGESDRVQNVVGNTVEVLLARVERDEEDPSIPQGRRLA